MISCKKEELLKLRRGYGKKGLELYRSASKKVSKWAGVPIMNINGKCQLQSTSGGMA